MFLASRSKRGSGFGASSCRSEPSLYFLPLQGKGDSREKIGQKTCRPPRRYDSNKELKLILLLLLEHGDDIADTVVFFLLEKLFLLGTDVFFQIFYAIFIEAVLLFHFFFDAFRHFLVITEL